MRRTRLSTLMLLVVIAALVMALVVQHQRASRRIAELEAIAAPTLKSLEQVAEKRRAEALIEHQLKRAKAHMSNSLMDEPPGPPVRGPGLIDGPVTLPAGHRP